MGSSFSVTFANYYMTTWPRYINDWLIVTDSVSSLAKIKQSFENNSVLKFTQEISIDKKINFLDVTVDGSNNTSYITSVYQKPTNPGVYLNECSECPIRYKDGTVKALIQRNYKISSSWPLFHTNMTQLKQALIKNGYSYNSFNSILRKFLNQCNGKEQPNSDNNKLTHRVYYQNQFSSNYKKDKRIIKSIIRSNTNCIRPNEQLNVIIYYKSNTISNRICRNNQSPEPTTLKRTNLIYEYKCTLGDCELLPLSYIGLTTATLSRRLTMHLAVGAIKTHIYEKHKSSTTRAMLVNNTKIIHKETNHNRLSIYEALLIQKHKAVINQQNTGTARTLKLFHDIYNS